MIRETYTSNARLVLFIGSIRALSASEVHYHPPVPSVRRCVCPEPDGSVGECARRINQILCDVNCKDDNKMKYFNNLLIVCAIISSPPPRSTEDGAHFQCKLLHFVRPTQFRDASIWSHLRNEHVHNAGLIVRLINGRDLFYPLISLLSFCSSTEKRFS